MNNRVTRVVVAGTTAIVELNRQITVEAKGETVDEALHEAVCRAAKKVGLRLTHDILPLDWSTEVVNKAPGRFIWEARAVYSYGDCIELVVQATSCDTAAMAIAAGILEILERINHRCREEVDPCSNLTDERAYLSAQSPAL